MNKFTLSVLLLSMSAFAFSEEGDVKQRDGIYGFGEINQFNPSSDRAIDDDDGYGFGLGYLINKNWGVEAQYREVGTDYIGATPLKFDFDTIGLDVVYNDTNWIGNSTTYPFVKIGAGDYNVNFGSNATVPVLVGSELGAFESESYIKLGLGLQHFFNDTVFVRAGYDFLSADDADDSFLYLNLGFFFGNTERHSAPEPAPVPVKAPNDSDSDGVIDANDRCPSTPAGAKVDANGCPVDTDRDGVFDYQDACSGTPYGAKVDSKGCRIKLSEKVVIDMRLNFDSNKADIKSEMVSEIAKVAEFMRQYPDVSAEIQGHTDSQGAAAYNKSLSQKRADSVVSYLISNFGISASRLSGVGYGEENPIADNSTREGRAANRRVEARLETVVEK